MVCSGFREYEVKKLLSPASWGQENAIFPPHIHGTQSAQESEPLYIGERGISLSLGGGHANRVVGGGILACILPHLPHKWGNPTDGHVWLCRDCFQCMLTHSGPRHSLPRSLRPSSLPLLPLNQPASELSPKRSQTAYKILSSPRQQSIFLLFETVSGRAQLRAGLHDILAVQRRMGRMQGSCKTARS